MNDQHRIENNDHESNDELMQQLMELHYGLLESDEESALRGRIESEADVAAAWAKALGLAGIIATATQIDGQSEATRDTMQRAKQKANVGSRAEILTPNVLAAPSANGQVGFVEPQEAVESLQALPTKTRFYIRSLIGLATAACLTLMVTGYRYVKSKPSAPPPTLQVNAEPVAPESAKSGREFELQTSGFASGSISRESIVVPASITFSVLNQGSVLFTGRSLTDDDGKCRVTVPDNVVVPADSELRVVATSSDGTAVTADLYIPLEPTKCLTYLSVDRPVYRPGETVYFRSLTLNRRTLAAHVDVPIRFEVTDPSGAAVGGSEIEGVTDRGVGNGSFHIPSAAPGGVYTLLAKSLDGFFPEERREFQVRAYRVPRLKKELEFRKRSFGSGETVEADFSVKRAEGDILAGATATVTARVDGQVVFQEQTTTASDGTLAISFGLPDVISKGAGTLSVMVDDGSVKETQSKTIPIHTGRVAIEFYPEGGYLVDGLDNRVYFVARNPLGEPIEVTGEVLSKSGQKVADLKTVRDGMGKFRFKPEYGQSYEVKVTAPLDVVNSPALPAVVKGIPVLETGEGVFDSDEPIDLIVRSRKRRPVLVHAVCRGELVGSVEKRLKKGDNALSIPLRENVGGVIRVTVLDSESQSPIPLVERLVFRRSDEQLKVSVVPLDNETESSETEDGTVSVERSPGEPLRLTLQVTDESGEPKPAVLGVSVVDDASLSLDETERPTLRSHFLLTSEVQKPEDLEHANFYLSDDESAEESLDLLLGTQGWRRFVSGSPNQPELDFQAQLMRLLEMDGPREPARELSYSNEPVFLSEWEDYRTRMSIAWGNLVRESRILLLLVVFGWIAVVAIRRRKIVAALGVVLLVVGAALIVGCGRSENHVIEYSAREHDAMKVGNEDYEAAMEEPSDDFANDESRAMDPSQSQIQPAQNESEWEDLVANGQHLLNQLRNDVSELGQKKNKPMDMGSADELLDADDAEMDLEKLDGRLNGKRDERSMLDPRANRIAQFRQQMQRFAESRGMDAKDVAEQLIAELRFPVRQYAHQHSRPDPEVRSDFAETLYWNPLLITDSKGCATIRFDLSDSVTMFRVNIDGHASGGRIGSGDAEVVSRLPFQIEPKLPLEVTTGDRIDLPVAVVNASKDDVDVDLTLSAPETMTAEITEASVSGVPAGERTRHYFPLVVGAGHAEQVSEIIVRGQTKSAAGAVLKDNIRRTLKVSPMGYPASEAKSGMINQTAEVELTIPSQFVPDSLAVTLRAYPSRLADLMSGVEGILREPHGCFEQTSATNYPNAMALTLMKQTGTANPEVTRKACGMLDRGYGKLTSFECEKLGYEWFGSDPGHEALSAFGLMQFADMAKIMEVDEVMVKRTRTWLMSRRDGNGGFHRNPRHLHVWSVQQEIVNAYVLWALTEAEVAAGQKGRIATELAAELKQLQAVADKSDDPYLIALSAASLLNAGKNRAGKKLLDRLAEMQAENGSLDGKTTVTSSGGISRKVETTSIAILAWMKSNSHEDNARRATMWLLANRQPGSGFGSTQATVLALKALVGAGKLVGSESGGSLEVKLDGETIGTATWAGGDSGSTVEIKGLGTEIAKRVESAEGSETVKLTLASPGSKNLAYAIDVSYHAITPVSDDGCPVKLTTEFVGSDKTTSMSDGATTAVKARLENKTDTGQPMTVAIVGLPGGVEPKMEELDELRDGGKFDYYELRGRDVVFYWRTIEPKAVKEIEFNVTATIPGEYTGPASRAYLYYTAESKDWTSPLKVMVSR